MRDHSGAVVSEEEQRDVVQLLRAIKDIPPERRLPALARACAACITTEFKLEVSDG